MSDTAGVFILIGRILFVLFPLWVSGYNFHVKNSSAAEGYAKAMGFPVPAVAGWPMGVWLIAASLSIAVGVFPDIGSLMLAAFVVPAAWYFHAYWKVEDPNQKQTQVMLFWRNVTTLGASLALFAFFASVDTALRFSVTGSLIHL